MLHISPDLMQWFSILLTKPNKRCYILINRNGIKNWTVHLNVSCNLPPSRGRTLAVCRVCDDVPFSFLTDVIVNLVDEVVIRFPSWNHLTLHDVLLFTFTSNQAGLPSRSVKLTCSKWSISISNRRKNDILYRCLGYTCFNN